MLIEELVPALIYIYVSLLLIPLMGKLSYSFPFEGLPPLTIGSILVQFLVETIKNSFIMDMHRVLQK
jgi:hypothetical protein